MFGRNDKAYWPLKCQLLLPTCQKKLGLVGRNIILFLFFSDFTSSQFGQNSKKHNSARARQNQQDDPCVQGDS